MTWFQRISAFGAGTALALIPLSGSADTSASPFLVTTTSQTADGTTMFRDVVIVDGNGDSGEPIATSSPDPLRLVRDRSCLGAIAALRRLDARRAPLAVNVILDAAHIVPVRLSTANASPASGEHLIEANGDATSAIGENQKIGVRVDARILAQEGGLESATFRQITYASSIDQPIDVSSCSVQRIPLVTGTATTPVTTQT